MKTVVLGDPPEVLISLIANRKRLGLDTHDEVWNGEYHMAPAARYEHADVGSVLAEVLGPLARRRGLRPSLPFNLGDATDFRVPDMGIHRGRPGGVWIPTVAIVVEICSPNDESYAKFDFYFEHDVEEILIVDPAAKIVTWFRRKAAGFKGASASEILEVTSAEISLALEW